MKGWAPVSLSSAIKPKSAAPLSPSSSYASAAATPVPHTAAAGKRKMGSAVHTGDKGGPVGAWCRKEELVKSLLGKLTTCYGVIKGGEDCLSYSYSMNYCSIDILFVCLIIPLQGSLWW